VLRVCLEEGFDGLAQFGCAPATESAQRLARKNAKPDFDLIEPTGRSWREVKMDVGVLGQPVIAFFVRAVVVQNHVQFLVGGSLSHDLIHELQEFLAPLQLRDGSLNLSGGHLQRREEIERAVALVGAFQTANDLAIVGFHIAGLPLQRLNTGLFINRDHQRFFRGIQIQPHNVSRFGGKLFVGAYTP